MTNKEILSLSQEFIQGDTRKVIAVLSSVPPLVQYSFWVKFRTIVQNKIYKKRKATNKPSFYIGPRIKFVPKGKDLCFYFTGNQVRLNFRLNFSDVTLEAKKSRFDWHHVHTVCNFLAAKRPEDIAKWLFDSLNLCELSSATYKQAMGISVKHMYPK